MPAVDRDVFFQCFKPQGIIRGLCPGCDNRAFSNTGGIQATLLISCCFHFWVSHPETDSIWWPVQQQEQIALLVWSQRMVAANKLMLHSDPCFWVCVCACVHVCCVCVRDPGWLVSNKEMKSIVGIFFSSLSEPFSFITSPALPRAAGCAPAPQPAPKTSIGSIYLVDRSAEWLLLLSRPHKNHSN